MTDYAKIIGLMGHYYTREFTKIKHHKNKIRTVKEDTIVKVFKEGNARITVFFQETGKEVVIDAMSSEEDIKKYLGKNFL